MNGIRRTKSGWLIDVDEYMERNRYHFGTRYGQVIRTTEDPTQKYNYWFPLVADMIIGRLLDGELAENCTIYRKGYIYGE